MSQRVFGITGNMGAGKDTVANALIELGICDKRLAFADVLKEAEKLIFNEPLPSIRRKLLQGIGVRMRDLSHIIYRTKDVWILPVNDKINLFRDMNFVISDVRFLNEAQWLIDTQRGILIYVDTGEEKRRRRIEIRDKIKINHIEWLNWHLHSSETGVADISKLYWNHPNFKIFDNNITLEEVKPKLKEMFE